MHYIPYSKKNADFVMDMLSNHFDFTPETEIEANNHENIEFFREVHIDENYNGVSYVLICDKGIVHGFLGAKSHLFENKNRCWYFSPLFIRNDKDFKINAQRMVESFIYSTHDADEFCACVYPGASEAISFWTALGFKPNPERSIYANTENERLVAYWKRR